MQLFQPIILYELFFNNTWDCWRWIGWCHFGFRGGGLHCRPFFWLFRVIRLLWNWRRLGRGRGTGVGLGVVEEDVFDVVGGTFEVVSVEAGIPVRTEETFLGLYVVVVRHCFLVLETVRIYMYSNLLFMIYSSKGFSGRSATILCSRR